MEYKSLFPVIVTPSISAVRDFYVNLLGFNVVFEADWYIQLHAPRQDSDKPIELAFMIPGLESQPTQLRPAFNGDGMIVTLEFEDVDSLYDAVRKAGYEMIVDLRDEPWGQRHFLLRGPGGIMLDVLKQIPPSEEFMAAYAEGSQTE